MYTFSMHKLVPSGTVLLLLLSFIIITIGWVLYATLLCLWEPCTMFCGEAAHYGSAMVQTLQLLNSQLVSELQNLCNYLCVYMFPSPSHYHTTPTLTSHTLTPLTPSHHTHSHHTHTLSPLTPLHPVPSTHSEAWIVCSGGYPEGNDLAPRTLTILRGKNPPRVLSSETTILDFICLPSSPYASGVCTCTVYSYTCTV